MQPMQVKQIDKKSSKTLVKNSRRSSLPESVIKSLSIYPEINKISTYKKYNLTVRKFKKYFNPIS